ncbi:MAG: cytochrome c peroxidase, partial [Burkholderiales bacterium]
MLVQAQNDEPVKPLPADLKLDAKKVALGEKLFTDKRLSKDNSMSCASCHDLGKGGIDGLPFSIGINGGKGVINVPTVLHSSFNSRQFWVGRAATLEEQTTGLVHNPLEVGSNWVEVIRKLSRDAALVEQVKKSYPDGLQAKNIADAITVFEQSLTTPNAHFDKYLRGHKSALSNDELRGLQLFKSYGCVACCQGMNVGGSRCQHFGVTGDCFAKRSNPTDADLGRYNRTKKNTDKHIFEVPYMCTAAVTEPYSHDGSAKMLADAVEVMY